MVTGCGSGDETERIKLVPVKGNVTFNGKPLDGATITFAPDEANDSETAGGGTTGPDGNYTAAFRGRDGLAPGKYKVLITKAILPPGMSKLSEDDAIMAREMNRVQGDGTPAPKAADPTQIQGEFDAEVSAGENTLDFDVKGKALPVTEPKS